MKHPLVVKAESQYVKKEVSSFNVGDTVRVMQLVREGDKSRQQAFEGIVIRKKGSGIQANFTVRRISFGEGVEKTFPFHSESVQNVSVVRRGKVRRSRLFYLRKQVGKQARINEARDEARTGEAQTASAK